MLQTDLALIFPYRSWDNFTNHQNNSYHPLGLHSISAYVKQFDYTTRVVTKQSKELTTFLEEQIKEIVIIGFSCLEDNLVVAANAIRYIKKRYPDKIIFVGGPQAMHLDAKFLEATNCDVIIRGEGELVIKALLDYYIKGIGILEEIKGIVCKKDGKVIDSGISDLICNLDELPFPDVIYGEDETVASIITGRGCPYHCAFCFDGGNSRKVRYRSIENVIEELDFIFSQNPQIRVIQFVDDTFMMNIKRTEKICEYFEELRKHRDVEWICEANVINIDRYPEMIDRMVKAGLIAMQVGIESGSDTVLKVYNKPSNIDMILRVFKICKAVQLKSLEGQIIVGGAFESDETIAYDCDLARNIIKAGVGITDISTVFLWPFPRTPITDSPEQFGIEIDKERVEHSIASLQNPVTSTKELTTDQIIYAKKKIDQVISTTYLSCCLSMKREEVLKLWNPKTGRFVTKWGNYLNSYAHIITSISMGAGNLTEYLEKFTLGEIYAVRTFALLQYEGKMLKFYRIEWTKSEQKILELSTGKISMQTILERLGAEEEEVIEICNQLYDRCLLTFSLC